MKRYKLTLRNREPFCIRADRADDVITTAEYIPGTTLIGALASNYIMDNGIDDRFHLYFTENKISFPNLYPLQEADNGYLVDFTIPVPIPKTAKVCKRWELTHGIKDTLFDWALYNQLNENNDKAIDILKQTDVCEPCMKNKQRMVPYSGFMSFNKESQQLEVCRVEKTLHAHTGINRYTQTVSEGIFYNLEKVEKQYLFEGIVAINDTVPDAACEAFKEWLSKEIIHIGTKKTSGLGACVLELEVLPDYNPEDFKNRLLSFDTAYKQYTSTHGNNNQMGDNEFYFSIDLLSDTIRVNDFLQYIVGFEGLPEEIGFNNIRLVYERVSKYEILGWNTQIRLPRQVEAGIEKGSTAFFASTMDKEELISTLFNMECEGIGIRKAEGFGRTLISSPFHYLNHKNREGTGNKSWIII